jgi:hypothetical protein
MLWLQLEAIMRICITLMRIRIRILLATFMRIRIRILCHFDVDPDYACSLMRMRIRILPFTMMRMRILTFNLMRIHADPDPQHWLEVPIVTGVTRCVFLGTVRTFFLLIRRCYAGNFVLLAVHLDRYLNLTRSVQIKKSFE